MLFYVLTWRKFCRFVHSEGYKHRFNSNTEDKIRKAVEGLLDSKNKKKRGDQYRIKQYPNAKLIERRRKGFLKEARALKRKSIHPGSNVNNIEECVRKLKICCFYF